MQRRPPCTTVTFQLFPHTTLFRSCCMVDGVEAFGRVRLRRKTDVLTVPLQLQVLECDYVPFDKNEDLCGGAYIEQGIEFDRIGRRVGYWMFRQHPGDPSNRGFQNATPIRVPASAAIGQAHV